MKSEHQISELAQKISKGLEIAFTKLVKEKAKTDGELIFSDNGKIIRVKAKQLLIELNIQ